MTTTRAQTRRVSIDEIKPHPRNPKSHAIDTLVQSIRRFGFVEPIVVDQRTGLNVSGHGRVEALLRMRDAGEPVPLGIDDEWRAPVFVGWASTDDAEAEAALVALNRIGESGGWEERELADLLLDLQQIERGLDGVGYDDEELAELRARLGDYAPDFDPVDADEQPRLDERAPIECGSCGASIDPTTGAPR